MPRIDFYILPETTEQERELFACRLIEKAYRLGHRILVLADSETHASELDLRLWAYRETSFLPHARLDTGNPARPPVEISWGDQIGDHQDMLVNLSRSLPPHYRNFARLAEIVVQEDSVLKATRVNYKTYKDQGQEIIQHDMRKK